jgi:hypothetical protein
MLAMQTRAKFVVAVAAMLYGAFLAERIALNDGFSVAEAIFVAAIVFLFSAVVFTFLIRLRAFLACVPRATQHA